MAVRPIYQSQTDAPFFKIIDVNFQFFSGFSTSQKQKSIESLHKQYNESYPGHAVLEISSKSRIELGVALSAFNLNLKTPQQICPVECAFQGSKVFEGGGPYVDLLDKSSREAKKDTRLRESGKLTAFQYFDQKFPLEPKDYFYNWLYANALMQNQDLASQMTRFDSFSDIEFNPQKSINCQAKAAAVFVGLSRQHLLEKALLSPKHFLQIVYGG